MGDAPDNSDGAAESPRPGIGVGDVLGKILDQLSLSAWPPAIFLVGVTALLLAIHDRDSFEPGRAVSDLVASTLGVVIVLAVATVLAVVIVQAFEFEVIRALEGYWGSGRIASRYATYRISRHAGRRRRLVKAASRARRRAFKGACRRLEKVQLGHLVPVLEADDAGDDLAGFAAGLVTEALAVGWESAARPEDIHLWQSLDQRKSHYPAASRVLPTRLGNTMRAAEDRMALADGGDLQGFIMRNYERIPRALLIQHSSSRTRLDMYCSLVFASMLLAPVSVGLLAKFGPLVASTSTAILVLFGVVAYSAGLSSARRLGAGLLAVDAEVSHRLAAQS